jgi:hypothetical protein
VNLVAQVVDLHFSTQDWEIFFLFVFGILLGITIYYHS